MQIESYRQGGIRHMHWIQLAVIQALRQAKRHGRAGQQAQNGIDDTVMFIAQHACFRGTDKAGPIDPQNGRTNQGQDVGNLVGQGSLFRRMQILWRSQGVADCQTKIGAKHVNRHATTHVFGRHTAQDKDDFIDGIKKGLGNAN